MGGLNVHIHVYTCTNDVRSQLGKVPGDIAPHNVCTHSAPQKKDSPLCEWIRCLGVIGVSVLLVYIVSQTSVILIVHNVHVYA